MMASNRSGIGRLDQADEEGDEEATADGDDVFGEGPGTVVSVVLGGKPAAEFGTCLLYTSDAADDVYQV